MDRKVRIIGTYRVAWANCVGVGYERIGYGTGRTGQGGGDYCAIEPPGTYHTIFRTGGQQVCSGPYANRRVEKHRCRFLGHHYGNGLGQTTHTGRKRVGSGPYDRSIDRRRAPGARYSIQGDGGQGLGRFALAIGLLNVVKGGRRRLDAEHDGQGPPAGLGFRGVGIVPEPHGVYTYFRSGIAPHDVYHETARPVVVEYVGHGIGARFY